MKEKGKKRRKIRINTKWQTWYNIGKYLHNDTQLDWLHA